MVGAFACVLIVWYDQYKKVKKIDAMQAIAESSKSRRKTYKEQPRMDVLVKTNGNAADAIDTLTNLGYQREHAEDLVNKALLIVPDGDCEILIQTAVKRRD